MSGKDFSIPTNCVVADYIQYRINKDKSQNLSNEVTNAMRNLCEEFEERCEKQFNGPYLYTCDVDCASYKNVLSNIIEDGCHWGRVVAIVAFSGAMSAYCLEHGREENVDLIRDWTVSFMNKHVDKWIKENNGWGGLVEFAKGSNKQEEKPNGWGSKLLVGAGAAVGAIAITALIASRA